MSGLRSCGATPVWFQGEHRVDAVEQNMGDRYGPLLHPRSRMLISFLVFSGLVLILFVTPAMRRCKEKGMECAALGVESENPSGAFLIYEALGFVPDRRNVAYIKVI